MPCASDPIQVIDEIQKDFSGSKMKGILSDAASFSFFTETEYCFTKNTTVRRGSANHLQTDCLTERKKQGVLYKQRLLSANRKKWSGK
jgi:hypothetical protein